MRRRGSRACPRRFALQSFSDGFAVGRAARVVGSVAASRQGIRGDNFGGASAIGVGNAANLLELTCRCDDGPASARVGCDTASSALGVKVLPLQALALGGGRRRCRRRGGPAGPRRRGQAEVSGRPRVSRRRLRAPPPTHRRPGTDQRRAGRAQPVLEACRGAGRPRSRQPAGKL